MLRFTIRDMLWLTALVAAGVAWWMEQHEAVALWHDASQKWVKATERQPPSPSTSGFMTPKTPAPVSTAPNP
jgi:hypothetical protein